ncbi:MAG: class A beta-lactamase-related serine hydrolase [Chloroflexi bacterium]|nr:class A beta-lactamase-related serine hydrolase [Chloroflexota bacterium]
MKRRFSIQSAAKTALIILGVIIVVMLVGNLVSFLSTRDRLPHNTYLGGVDVSSLGVEEAISRTERTLQTPIALRYQGNIIQLKPEEVEFQLNAVVARLQLEKVLGANQGLDKLPGYVLRHTVDVSITTPYQYSEEKLDGFLRQIASEQDQQPQTPQPDLATLTLSAGQDGLALNIEDAREPVLAALASGTARLIDLPVDVVPSSSTTLAGLGELVKARLTNFVNAGNTAGVFIKDLNSGQEFSLNGDVAFSGQGWVKLAILMEAYRSAGESLNPQTAALLTTLMTEGSTASANEVLKTVGNGDALAGANQMNAMLKRMGLVSTFLAQPFDQPSNPSQVVTPGNSRTDVSTAPDSNAQSTPAEVSLLFEMLEQCRNNTGALPLVFPNEFTAARCEQILGAMGQNGANVLIMAGSPGATVIHRQSWDANNHGDAALVRTPGGTYVIAVMLHSNGSLNWGETSLIVSDIARATYGFFNQGQVPAPVQAMNAAPPP